MKILQINAIYNLGSTGKTCFDFQTYVQQNTEHTCKTAFCYGGNAENGYVIGNRIDRKVHGFLSRLTGKQAWFSYFSTFGLIKYMKEYKPDVVQLRNLHGNYINFPMLMKYIAKNDIATVITLHDCWVFTGKCCHYTSDRCYKWQTGCYDCPRLKKDNKSWFLDRTKELWRAKRKLFGSIPRLAVQGVSKWTVEEAKKSPIMENAKIFTYIYNGIDSNKFKPTESNLREKYNLVDKKILLGVASGWQKSKGLPDVIEMSEILPDDCVIVLVGHPNEPIPTSEKIINIPATENIDELVQWYSAADVFINMSKEETFGKVSAEALMCGTPVVCYNTTANPELVGENCGYICETENVVDFKNLVLKVIENGKDVYTESCIKFAHENFSTEKNFEAYIKLYEKLFEV